MTIARSNILDPEESGIYHCWSRCVRKAFLCGYDRSTKKSYEHRRAWIVERLKFLVTIFVIDVLAFAIMTNHNHLALRNRLEDLNKITDLEIAKRWLTLFPKRRNKDGKPAEPNSDEIQEITNNPERVEVLRKRLGSISWFMRCLKEDIATRANREDQVTGHFWEQRFKCKKIEGQAALLTTMVYIDLNEVRARMVNTPEESLFTSAYQRIVSNQARKKIELIEKNENQVIPQSLILQSQQDDWLASFEDRDNNPSVFEFSFEHYLEVLDETGRCHVQGKRGSIPEHIKPILERLDINCANWLDATTDPNLLDKFSYFITSASNLKNAADKLHKSWLKGMRQAKLIFL